MHHTSVLVHKHEYYNNYYYYHYYYYATATNVGVEVVVSFVTDRAGSYYCIHTSGAKVCYHNSGSPTTNCGRSPR